MGRVVMFDVDGCLADFVWGFTSLREKMGGAPALQTHEQETWDGLWQPEGVWDAIKRDPCFWAGLRPLPDFNAAAVERINCWQHTYGWPVYFVTQRVGVDPKRQTQDWLLRHDVWRPTVLISKHKGDAARMLGATYAIDDKAENAWCVHWLSPATRIFLLDAPYNRYDASRIGASGVVRIHSLGEFLDAVEEDAR